MTKIKENEEREERIIMEIVVDAYGEEERALGWYYYLEGVLQFPFEAKCIAARASSPLRVGDQVDVVEMPPEDECMHEMFVNIRWERRPLAVPLSQLQAIKPDPQTKEAIEDWHYWVARGYEF
jgi:hypothetical protein